MAAVSFASAPRLAWKLGLALLASLFLVGRPLSVLQYFIYQISVFIALIWMLVILMRSHGFRLPPLRDIGRCELTESARESERVARLRYQNGVASQLEWLDAQRQRADAEQTCVSSEYRLRSDQARWTRALGRDPEGPWRRPPGERVEQEKSLPSR